MKVKRFFIIAVVLILSVLLFIEFDSNIRYNIRAIDYFKYNKELSEIEKEVSRTKPILFGVYNYPPIAFTNEYNNYNSGIAVDYISQLGIELGATTLLKANKKEVLEKAILDNEVDVILVEGDFDSESILKTQNLCNLRAQVLVKRNSIYSEISDLSGKHLAVMEKNNHMGKLEAFNSLEEPISLILVDNIYQCFALLNTNIVDGIFGTDMELAHFINATNKSAAYRFLPQTVYEKTIAFGVNKNNTDLLNALDKGIIRLKKKNLIAQTQYKWLGDFETYNIDINNLKLTYKVLLGLIIVVGFFSIWNYVITQKVNEKTLELSESKAELRQIIDTMSNGIILFSSNNEVLDCNDAVTRLTNIDRNMLLGKSLEEIDSLKAFLNETKFNKINKIGNKYFIANKLYLANSNSLVVIDDYTDKYLMETRARQEAKMIAVGQLSAGLAHEIRNPLGLIKTYSYLIEKSLEDKKDLHAIKVINDSSNRINKLIENLLRFSRLSNEETKRIDIRSLVDMLAELEAERLKADSINFSYYVIGKNEVEVNEDIVKMVILNLLNNSKESFRENDKLNKAISLKVEVTANEMIIIVSDNGVGIEPENLENIFNPFYSTKDDGTGLGLYILSSELTNYGGSIIAESEPNIKTSFTVTLPIKEATDERKGF